MVGTAFAPRPAAGDPADTAVPCPPGVILEGRPEVTAPIAAALTQDGIVVPPADGCPAVHALIEPREQGLVITILDVNGRRSERIVADARSAAALAESWARGDLVEPLLAGRTPGMTTEALVTADPPAALEEPAPPAADVPIVGFDLAGETAVALDASVWFGVHLAGCVRLGPTCVGALARFSADSGLAGDSAETDTQRLGLDVLLVADFPIDCGPVFVTPGVGFGAGWMNASTTAAAGDDVDVDGGGMRADAHVTLTIPVGAGLAIDVALGADVWILAHTSRYEEDGTTLAGEPRARFRGTIGLRYGAP